MRRAIKQFALIVAGALLAGCAGMKSGLVLETAGPAPMSAPPAQSKSGSGTLTVYSANKVNAGFNNSDPNRRVCSDYRILDSDKKLLERVHNVTQNMIQGPVSVQLPAGKYFVVARSNGFGTVTIPTIIAANQETVLRLNNGYPWPDDTVFNATNAVRLPDGEIVGWKNTPGH